MNILKKIIAWQIVDKIIPYWCWFFLGFAIIAVVFAILNFAMNIVIMFTVKGIYMPTWMLGIISIVMVGICTLVGCLFDKHNIQNRVASYQNVKMNPEICKINEIGSDIKEIKKFLGMEDDG
jgi:hypothetical protein